MQKPKFLTKSVRDEMQEHCAALRKLADQLQEGPEATVVLQNGVQATLKNCDAQTRNYIFRLADVVLASEHEGQKCLINPAMQIALDKYKNHMKAGIMTKQLIDSFMACVQKIEAPDVNQEDIYQSIIMRLLMELPHDRITDMLTHLAPAIAFDKETFNQRHMYG
jgi:hypothetical protein